MNPDQHRDAMARAESLADAGELAAASALYREILAADPQYQPACHALGMLAHAQGDLQLAADLFRRAAASSMRQEDLPTQVDLQQLAGLFVARRHAEAALFAEELTRRFPRHGAAWNALGAIHGMAGRHDAALQSFLRAATLMPDDAETWNNLGIAQRKAGKPAEAEACFRQAVQLQPDYADAYLNLATLLENIGRFDEAEGAYSRVLQLKPDSFDAHFKFGNMLLALGRAEDAVTSYRRAVQVRPDVSEAHNNLGIALRNLGYVAEAEMHYRQAIRIRENYAEAHNNLGINLIDQRRFREAESCTRRALQLRPDYAEAHSNLGVVLHELGRLAEAEASYRAALAHKPDYPHAHYNLGLTLTELERASEAEASYRKALELTPHDAEGHLNLGIVLKEKGDLDGAESCYRQALALDSQSAKAYNNLGIVLAELGRLDESEASLQRALAITGDYAEAHYNLGLTWLAAGRLQQGWPKYEYRWEGGRPKRQRPATPLPQWTGQAVAGEARILVFGEQGMGDKLQFARYLPLVQERFTGGVGMVVDSALLALFRHAFPGIEFFEVAPQDQTAWHFQCPLLSLPLAFQTSLESIPATIPYLFADPAKLAKWKNRIDALQLPTVGKAGLVWKTGPLMKNAPHRSLKLEQLSRLFQHPNWQWFSLQKELDAEEVTALAANKVIDWSAEFNDFSDTAALIANLDLVVSVDTAVAHLAGAMGKRVWLLNRRVGEWRWMRDREDSPWYPGMRIFTQRREGEWDEVVERIRATL